MSLERTTEEVNLLKYRFAPVAYELPNPKDLAEGDFLYEIRQASKRYSREQATPLTRRTTNK
ncbi:MAG: hypothetical protein CMH64_02435 [Nanoarchaeota archaeon]|nr:hypothetical protein [Nanoarchaeota archaeon]|tara:strand:+ start:1061 stop:1246 length:186 start_codon:yes stop_codon:yes gene_type:complete